MQAVRRPIEAIRTGGPEAWLVVALLAALGLAYSSLFTVGKRYGFELGMEYWLFRPTDNAPLVILVLAGWLFYRRWYRVQSLPRATAPAPLLGLCVVGAVALHAWAVYTLADDLKVFSLQLAIVGLLLAFWGAAGVRALLLPLVFMLFAIPIPAPLLLAIVYKLQIWTADFAGFLLYTMGLPALVSGDQIVRAEQTFQVIEGCSGLRSIETLAMLTILMVDLFGRRGWHAWALVLVAPVVAFLLNGVRVITLILNPHSEIVSIHNLQGIAILLVGLLIVYGIDSAIERATPDSVRPGPWRAKSPVRAPRRFSRGAAFAVGGALALATPVSAFLVPVRDNPPYQRKLDALQAEGLGDWPSQKIEIEYSFRGSTRFGEVVHRRYQTPEGPITVFVGTGDLGQRGGSPISPINAMPGSGWMVRERTNVAIGPDERPARSLVVERGKERVLARHWYVGHRGLLVESWRSLLALDRSPLERAGALYVVRLETPIIGRDAADRLDAEARLDEAWKKLAPHLEALQPTRVDAARD